MSTSLTGTLSDLSITNMPSVDSLSTSLVGNMSDLSVATNKVKSSIDISALQTQSSVLQAEAIDHVIDRSWAKQAFLLQDFSLSPNAVQGTAQYDANINYYNRFYTTANQKFTDTKLGGSIGVNARPQFTRYSDIRVPGKLVGRIKDVTVSMGQGPTAGASYGLGRYYSEAIDDNSQTIYLRFGVPSFNSLTNYISAAYDPDLASLARTGRGTSIFYTAASWIGSIATVTAMPLLSIAFVSGKILMSFFRSPNSKFYTMKPSMHTYWGAVNSLVNSIAINAGLFPPFLENNNATQAIGQPWQLDNTQLKQLHAMMPDVFTDGNGYDIFAMGTKAQRFANALAKNEYDSYNQGSETDFFGYVKKSYLDTIPSGAGTHSGIQGIANDVNNALSLTNFVKQFLSFGAYQTDDKKTGIEQGGIFSSRPKMDANGKPVVDSNGAAVQEEFVNTGQGGWFNEFTSSIDAEMRQGSEFAIFKVDSTGPASESFGNATTESQLSQQLNNTSSSNREARFSIADGNIAPGVGDAIGAVTDVVSGLANGVTLGAFGGIAALAGNGFFDIPKHWQSSTASLPRANYTMSLISPYGNIISQMQNIYIPLAMIMAGSMPLSTGKYTYTSPFLCQVYDRGRCQITLGMVESLTITRGTSSLGFTNRGKALAIDVSFNIVDLSSLMHMPLSTGAIFGSDPANDPDNILMDYLSVLAGQDIYSQVYKMPKARIRLATKYAQIRNFISPAQNASMINDSMISGWGRWLFPISIPYNVVSALVTGNSSVVNDTNMFK